MRNKWITISSLLILPTFSFATNTAAKRDNTAVNALGNETTRPTADQQKNNKSDLKLTQEIRQAVVAEDDLSTYAHNIKIITRAGKVTLRGPVRSETERNRVAKIAADIAGEVNVTNHIEIAAQ